MMAHCAATLRRLAAALLSYLCPRSSIPAAIEDVARATIRPVLDKLSGCAQTSSSVANSRGCALAFQSAERICALRRVIAACAVCFFTI